MAPEGLFAAVSTLALGGWIVLAMFPRKPWASRTLCGLMIPAVFGTLYCALIAWQFPSALGGFSSLADVALLFSNPWLLLAGWIHYLAFDLLIGSWEARDAVRRGIPQLLLLPCLALTFLFGPAGWLLYLTIRSVLGRGDPRWSS